jgi:hypothetical protein
MKKSLNYRCWGPSPLGENWTTGGIPPGLDLHWTIWASLFSTQPYPHGENQETATSGIQSAPLMRFVLLWKIFELTASQCADIIIGCQVWLNVCTYFWLWLCTYFNHFLLLATDFKPIFETCKQVFELNIFRRNQNLMSTSGPQWPIS